MATQDAGVEDAYDELTAEIARLERERAELAQRVTKLERAVFAAGGGADRYDQAVLRKLARMDVDEFTSRQVMAAYRSAGIKDRSKIKDRVADLKRDYGEYVGDGRFRLDLKDVVDE